VPGGTLTGPTQVTVTNSPNSGTVIGTWIPSGKPAINLILKTVPSPQTNDYSFVWPTQKYLDDPGVLRLQSGTTASTPVDISVTLSNGNATDFQHAPNDWASFLPGPWTQSQDPLIVAVGDGASDEAAANALAQSIKLADPDLFLYLGDIYETGTFTENLNHYGQNSMDGGPGTLWGQMGTITQPTIGNHEDVNVDAWRDYFHGRPLYTSFRFGNVLFFDLATDEADMSVGSAQYNYVNSILTSTTDPPPPCIVAFFHKPALEEASISSSRLPMWSLLTDKGGDLVFNGHAHKMLQYKPLNSQLQLPSVGQPTMVELISGAGGHNVSSAFTGDARVEWSVGKTPGAVHLTLNGAANGGTPTSLSWAYKSTSGAVLHTGTRDCGGSPPVPVPSITGFSPNSGPVGTSVTISGTGFTGATIVRFGTTNAATFTVDSNTQIRATVPAGASSGPISVVTPGGTATSTGSFTVIPPPSITGFSPASGPDGTVITIYGSGFTWATAVTLNGTNVAGFTVVTDAQIRATVPGGASSGLISVVTPGGTATSTGIFTVTDPPVPSITGFLPVSGGVGTVVTIDGSGFTGAGAVTLNGTNVAGFTVVTDAQITATVPEGASSGQISVVTPGGTATSSGTFTVIPPPSITGFSPDSGLVGTSVTIDGTGFTGTTAVRFGTTSVGAGEFTIVTDEQITATVPAGAGTAPISVDAPGGTATSAGSFTVNQPPSISGFSPASGPVGTSVTLGGSAFDGATAVRFGTTSATTFTVVSNTQITATVPAGAITAPISVDGPGGTGTSSGNFAVTVAFIATDDAEIDLKLAASNFGAAAIFGVDNKPVKHSLLKFDVDVGANSIASVKLRLYCVDPAPLGGTFFSTGTNWGEGTVTWNDAPPSVGASYASLGTVKAGTWYEVDLTQLVQANGTYSLRITSSATNGADYATKERPGAFAPHLVVAIGP
jgi:hypothetical protein